MTREERVALNKRRSFIIKIKFIVLGTLCIVSGSLRYYFYGYTDSTLITFCSFSFLWIGWIILSIAFGIGYYNDRKTVFKNGAIGGLKQKAINFFIFGSFGVMIATNVVLIGNLERDRIDEILNTEPTVQTTALVVALEVHNTLVGSRDYAIIEYDDGALVIRKSVLNSDHKFILGNKYSLIYARWYPEMFKIYF